MKAIRQSAVGALRAGLIPVACLAVSLASPACGDGSGIRSQEESPADAATRSAALENFVASARRLVPRLLQEENVAGAALGLVERHGLVWAEGFGFTDRTRSRSVDPDTLFSIQSLTKSVTATAVMSAVEDGVLDLDRPVSAWLPDLRIRTRFDGEPTEQITLRHLLSHRAGLTHEAPLGNSFSADAPSFEAHVASIGQTWLRYRVGERFAYSNLGFDLAGRILEQASDRPFATVVAERVLEPLGMERSRFDAEAVRGDENRAVGERDGVTAIPIEIPSRAARGLYASVRDLARFVAFQLARGQPLLSDRTWRAMHTIPMPVSDHQRSGYGLGVTIHRQGDGAMVAAGHGGGGYGFLANAAWMPELGIGYVVLQNSEGSDRLIGEVDRLFTRAALEASGSPLPGGPLPFESDSCLVRDASAESRYQGVYVGRAERVLLVRRHGVLGVEDAGFAPLCFLSEEFAVRRGEGPARPLRFEFDPGGRPTRLVELESGASFDYNDGPEDPAGVMDPRWEAYLGRYAHAWYGEATEYLDLRELNGHLYFDGLRLVSEAEPGLFFASNGEVLDLRGEPPRWRSVAIRRVGRPLAGAERRRAVERARSYAKLLEARDLEAFLGACTGSARTELEGRLGTIWEALVARHGAPRGELEPHASALGPSTLVILTQRLATGLLDFRIVMGPDERIEGVALDLDPPTRSWWRLARARS